MRLSAVEIAEDCIQKVTGQKAVVDGTQVGSQGAATPRVKPYKARPQTGDRERPGGGRKL